MPRATGTSHSVAERRHRAHGIRMHHGADGDARRPRWPPCPAATQPGGSCSTAPATRDEQPAPDPQGGRQASHQVGRERPLPDALAPDARPYLSIGARRRAPVGRGLRVGRCVVPGDAGSAQGGQHLRRGAPARGHRPVHVARPHAWRSRCRPSGRARPARAAPGRSGSTRWARTACRSTPRSRARPASRAPRSRRGAPPWARSSARRSRGRPCAAPRRRPVPDAGPRRLRGTRAGSPGLPSGGELSNTTRAPSPSPVACPLKPSARQNGSS